MKGAEGVEFGEVEAHLGQDRAFQILRRVQYHCLGSKLLLCLENDGLQSDMVLVPLSAETWEIPTTKHVFHAWDAGYDPVHVFITFNQFYLNHHKFIMHLYT